MPDFSHPQDFAVSELRLFTRIGVYRGRGFLHWAPTEGATIRAFLEEEPNQLPAAVAIPSVSLPQRYGLRFTPDGFDWAITALPDPHERLDVLMQRQLHETVRRLVLRREYQKRTLEPSLRTGSARYRILERTILPDQVELETKLAGHTVLRSFEMAALRHEEAGGFLLTARCPLPGTLTAAWMLPKTEWERRGHDWAWAEALRYALSLMTGQEVRLLERTVFRGPRDYLELRADARPARSLGVQAPFGPEAWRHRERIVTLAKFFARGGEYAHICRRIFDQLAEATRQQTLAARELLTATILEAVLRNLEKHPFVAGPSKWPLAKPLERFRVKYLGEAWREACKQALDVQRHLRNRNAHPDWLLSKVGELSDDELRGSTDDLIYLSWFYGYVILALAGERGLKPAFPLPHEKWPPMGTVTLS